MLKASDVIVLLTDHRQFRELPGELLAGRVVVDTRGIWRDVFWVEADSRPKSIKLPKAA